MALQEKFIYYDSSIDFRGKSVLITGGTGSFGKAVFRFLLDNTEASRIAIYSRDEQKQFDMAMVLSPEEQERTRFFVGDIRDVDRLSMALNNVDYVIHAAALKIVPMAEYNPFECIQTNVIGAENVVRASIERGVNRVIALSTDKACSPINLYGASKLASDKIFVAANHLSGSAGCRFSVVRYGNVMGSRGSVLPFFQKLLKDGADHLPITDPRMTRFWITLQQGIEFVMSSLSVMQGGEVFVPKIPSMRVVDLAKVLAPDVPHKTIGIRPGEKLHETMVALDDARLTVELDDRFVIEPVSHLWDRNWTSFAELGGNPVLEDFEYRSDTNSDWMDTDRLKDILNGVEKKAG